MKRYQYQIKTSNGRSVLVTIPAASISEALTKATDRAAQLDAGVALCRQTGFIKLRRILPAKGSR